MGRGPGAGLVRTFGGRLALTVLLAALAAAALELTAIWSLAGWLLAGVGPLASGRPARGLVPILGLGALISVPLAFLTGGRRLVRRHARAVAAAATDDLTGLGSRRAFRRELAEQVARARGRYPLTLALIDLNGLELVNATTGRRSGDALLAVLGPVLGGGLGGGPGGGRNDGRNGGRAGGSYRIGGDAFAVLLPGAGLEEAFAQADRIRRRIAEDAAPLTANVGLSTLDEQRCPDAETLLIAADAALFEARALGGNRVVGSAEATTGLRWLATSGRDPDPSPAAP